MAKNVSSPKKNAAAGNLRKAFENPERNEWNEIFIVVDTTIRLFSGRMAFMLAGVGVETTTASL